MQENGKKLVPKIANTQNILSQSSRISLLKTAPTQKTEQNTLIRSNPHNQQTASLTVRTLL
jgi:hypothetical protein